MGRDQDQIDQMGQIDSTDQLEWDRSQYGSGDEESHPLTHEPELEFEIEDVLEPVMSGRVFPTKSTLQLIFSPGVSTYILGIFCGSFMTAISKYAMRTVDPYLVMAVRMFATFLPSAFWLWYTNVPGFIFGPPGNVRMLLIIRSIVGTLNIACVYYAIQHIALPDFNLINFLAPLLTAIAAHVFLNEAYYWQQAVASLTSLLGVAIISRPSFLLVPLGLQPKSTAGQDPQHDSAVVVQLVQVVGTTTILCLLRKIGTRAHPLASVGIYSGLCTLSASVYVALQALGRPIRVPRTAEDWLYISLCGITGFCYQYLLSASLSREKASVLTQFDYTSIIFYTGWEYALWHDFPDWITFLGGGLILSGVYWSTTVRAGKEAS